MKKNYLATHLLSPAHILWKVIAEYGHDPEPIFTRQGIDFEMLLTPGMRVSQGKKEGLWLTAAKIIGDPCFGLHAAKFWHPSHFNALGYAWLASSTLREAMKRADRYFRILSNTTDARVVESDAGVSLIVSRTMRQPAHMDLTMAIFVTMCRLNIGTDFSPVSVEFMHPEPDCSEKYRTFFNAPVRFDTEVDRITISVADADARLPSGNPNLASLNDQVLLRYLKELDQQDVVHRIQSAIVDKLSSGKITDEVIARAVNMSVRSLQRRLHEAGTTFGGVLDRTREELARKYVAGGNMVFSEIAFLLGFSEQSAFSRAFKRWTGMTPTEFRCGHKA